MNALTTLRVQQTTQGWWVYDYKNWRVVFESTSKREAMDELVRLVNEAHAKKRTHV